MDLIIQKRVSLRNQKCEIQPTHINSNAREYSQGIHYYPFTVKLDRCFGSCNTLNNLSNKVCGIMINVDMSIKNIIYVKKITFGILLHVAVKMVNI